MKKHNFSIIFHLKGKNTRIEVVFDITLIENQSTVYDAMQMFKINKNNLSQKVV